MVSRPTPRGRVRWVSLQSAKNGPGPAWALRTEQCVQRGTDDQNPDARASGLLRKEVIQPQVPLRLPCYDFTPVAGQTLDACPPCGLAQRLLVQSTPMV